MHYTQLESVEWNGTLEWNTEMNDLILNESLSHYHIMLFNTEYMNT